jgi:hypothetical protein
VSLLFSGLVVSLHFLSVHTKTVTFIYRGKHWNPTVTLYVHDVMVMWGELTANFVQLSNQKEFWGAIHICVLLTIRRNDFKVFKINRDQLTRPKIKCQQNLLQRPYNL